MSVYSVILLMLPSKLNPYKRKETLHQLFHDDKELFCHVEILKALNQIGIDLIQVSILATLVLVQSRTLLKGFF